MLPAPTVLTVLMAQPGPRVRPVLPAAMVSMAHHVRVFVPAGSDAVAVKAAKQLDYVNNDLILNATIKGDLDLNLDRRLAI